MVARYIAEAVFQGASGLAKDRYINTFHFVGGTAGANSAEMMTAAARLANFYVAPDSTAVHLTDFMSSTITTAATINVYDYDEPKPRTPYPFHFTLPALVNAKLPEEICLCLSYYSARNVPRQRGRIYFGPLGSTALGASSTLNSRPSDNLINCLSEAGKRLAHVEDGVVDISNVLTDGLFIAGLLVPGLHPELPAVLNPSTSFPTMSAVNWTTFSEIGDGTRPTKKHPTIPDAPVPTFSLVTAGWVDNEWDGQDRRRVASSARVDWSAL
jgi:hypothetical protein